MNYNLSDIIKYIKPFHRDQYGRFYEEIAEDFVGKIPEEYDLNFNVGISKFVLIPVETNYVIKIPFTGYYDDEELVRFKEDAFYRPFDCYGKSVWDACAYEEELYLKAKELGIALFFLPIKKVGEYKSLPIYIQPKAVSLWKEKRDSYKKLETGSKKIHNKLTSGGIKVQSEIVAGWYEEVLNNIGPEEKFNVFLDFLREEEIDQDLHESNVGHYMGVPVIIDYAGFVGGETYVSI